MPFDRRILGAAVATVLVAAAGAGPAVAASGLRVPGWPQLPWAPAASCRAEPLAVPDRTDLERTLRGACRLAGRRAEASGQWAWRREGGGPQARLSHRLRWGAETLAAQLRVDVVGGLAQAGGAGEWRARADWAGTLWWRPDEDWTWQLQHGERHVVDGQPQRLRSVTAVWRPVAGQMLIARWQGRDDDDPPAWPDLGWRWWLQPDRLAIDLQWPARGLDEDRASLRLRWTGWQL